MMLYWWVWIATLYMSLQLDLREGKGTKSRKSWNDFLVEGNRYMPDLWCQGISDKLILPQGGCLRAREHASIAGYSMMMYFCIYHYPGPELLRGLEPVNRRGIIGNGQ